MYNALKRKLANDGIAYGIWVVTTGLDTAKLTADMRPDFIMFDGEHGGMDFERAGKQMSMIRGSGVVPMLRLPYNNTWLIKRGLDQGAFGIMLPMVESRAEAERAVAACRYPPDGIRGAGTGRACSFGTFMDDVISTANEEVQLIVQIESVQALKNMDEILSVPGIDIAFFGPYDMAISMGVDAYTFPDKVNHKDVLDARAKFVATCQKYGIVPSTTTYPSTIERDLDAGLRMLFGGNEVRSLGYGIREFQNAVDEALSLPVTPAGFRV